ncbi:MAG: hypothetical protein L0177_11540 [Chloroflexi bacterium]|nr:hypothetical protein [Chloroflexota bacterium]
MLEVTREQVIQLAQAAGLSLDDKTAEAIASRMRGVLEELDGVSDESLYGVEPLPIFMAYSFDRLTMSDFAG